MFTMQQAPNITELPGIEGVGVAPVVIAEVDRLVESYVSKRDARMEQTRQEVEAKRALIDSLRAHVDTIGKTRDGAIVYRHADLICTLRTGKDELKVTTTGDIENED